MSHTGITPILGVLALNGVGFVFIISGLTAAMVNAVPVELAGMASGTASVVRDLGQTMGPAVIGTVALGQAAPLLADGLASANLPPAQLHPAQTILADGGPIAVASARLGPKVGEIATQAAGLRLFHRPGRHGVRDHQGRPLLLRRRIQLLLRRQLERQLRGLPRLRVRQSPSCGLRLGPSVPPPKAPTAVSTIPTRRVHHSRTSCPPFQHPVSTNPILRPRSRVAGRPAGPH